MKVSKKQKEVLQRLGTEGTIILVKGLNTHCFMSKAMSYRISIATLFRLEDLKLVEMSDDKRNSAVYKITEMGKEVAIS